MRHTVGLSDPLSEKEISEDARLMDGLPQSLESNLRVYGLTHLKIKLSGEIATDVKRLKRILSVLERERVTDYAITLDGNEQFHSVSSLQTYWTQLNIVTALKPMLDHLLYVEQPLHRDAALCPTTQDPLRRWVERPVMIIDESDDQLDSLKVALDCGYCGTSHKNCKGIFKSVANACLLEHLRRSDPSGTYILSGEDLVNTGPVALPQDLAMMANLGVKHVERNGHHYFSGMSMFSEGIQNQVLTSHPDLYHRNAQGVITVKIYRGKINLYSCLESPFGTSISPDLFTDKIPVSNWNFESLLLH